MKSLYSFAILQMIVLFAMANCIGQSYYFKHYQTDNGLPHNSVTAILQDHKGLMWIGSRGGLSRFDGYTFKPFKNKKSKFGNIGNNVIIDMIESPNKVLWIGTGKGLFSYNPYLEIFTPLKGLPETYINQVLTDQENNVYVIADRKLYLHLYKQDKLLDLNTQASCMALDSDANLWIGDDDGMLHCHSLKHKKTRKIRIIDEAIPKNLRSISKLYPTASGELLIGCFKQGLKSYHLKSGKIRSLPMLNSGKTNIYVRDIVAGYDQEYWIGTESGIFIYDLTSNTSRNLRKRSGDPYALADNAVYSLCKDRRGGMWVGTFFGGLNYYSKENARFEKYYHMPGSNSISGDAVREICADNKGNLWIGTEDAGVNQFNPKTGKFINYTATGKKGDVSYPNIHGLLALDNQLFLGPFLNGLEIMDMRNGRITERFKFIGDENDRASDFVLSIYLTRDSTLLIGTAYTGSGLFTYDRKLKTFSRIKQIPYNSYVFAISEDQDGNIWTGSVSSGAFYYNPKTRKQGNIRFGDTINGKVSNEFAVYGIQETSDRSLWFTTEGGGLIRMSPDRKRIKKFTTETGFPSNVVFRVLEDDAKRLWISSLKGLICFDMQTEKFKVYTQSNGLITDQFNFNSAYKDPQGKMYFGSVKGLIAFHPKEFELKETGPATYITGFQINNKELAPGSGNSPLRRSIVYTDSVLLAHDQNNLSIEFAALNFSSPEVTRYEFMMEGLNESKTYLSSNRKAYFTGLPAGNYTFIVRAKSNVDSWTGNERRLFIKVLPPFWKSQIAYLIYFFLGAAVIYACFRYYHLYLERKNLNKLQRFENEKEKEIYQAKIEFFTNIAHEIQTPLTLILGPVERMIKKSEQPGLQKSLFMVEKNAKRLAELTSQLLDFRKTEMHQFGLSFVNVDIQHLLREQINLFRPEAERRNLTLELEVPAETIILYADREALIKICSNLISNAIKYAANSSRIVLAPLNSETEQVNIRFINDGKGIPYEFRTKIFEPFFRLQNSDQPGTGIGLPLAKSLTELHNGSLKLLSDPSNMVIFELTLPVHQAYEFKLSSWKKIK